MTNNKHVYPNRTIAHQNEAEAIKIVNSIIPKYWIAREVSERDYGIDMYIELTSQNQVTGNLVAIQVKGVKKVLFNKEGVFKFAKFKSSTVNYWRALPIPVFLFIVCLESQKCYFVSISEQLRKGNIQPENSSKGFVQIDKNSTIKKGYTELFNYIFLRERRWPDVEKAMENSLMTFNSLGPFCLMCIRGQDLSYCSSSMQYMLIQHYKNCQLLCRYVSGTRPIPKDITYWYDEHLLNQKKINTASGTFSFGLIKKIIQFFISDYFSAVKTVYRLVLQEQREYYSNRFPHLTLHLTLRPLVFIEEDWYCRYIHDEYERDTMKIEKKFFEDFTDYDGIVDLSKLPY